MTPELPSPEVIGATIISSSLMLNTTFSLVDSLDNYASTHPDSWVHNIIDFHDKNEKNEQGFFINIGD